MAYVTLGSKAVGSTVKIKINGTAWEWIVVHQGNPSTSVYDASCNGTWLLLQKVYEKRQWHSSGVNDYANSTIHSYLNGTWLNLIDASIRAQIKQVKIPYRPGSGTSSTINGGTKGLSCKVFLLSGIETNSTNYYVTMNDGAKLSYFNTGDVAIANEKRIAYLGGDVSTWWIRSPYIIDAAQSGYVSTHGGHSGHGGQYPEGVRPAMILPANIHVDDGGNVIANPPPTVPGSISVPATIKGGATAAISWTASTDPNGNLAGYILERSASGGGWTQIYKGSALSYTDTITKGWTSVAYRVKAYDSEGAQSGYRTSETRSVLNNTAPTISGSDSSLGTKTGAFSQSYTVTDPDAGQTLSVTEKLDGVTRRTYTATSGAANSFAITAAEWVKILNGTHTIAISVSDGNGGSATRTWTFAKNTTEIDVTLASPLTADAMPTKGVANIVGELPAGAQVTFEVCNNGFDASPAWEDVTSQVLGRNKFFLANKTKTASKWGFNFRLRVNRGSATGTLYIESVGGNFE